MALLDTEPSPAEGWQHLIRGLGAVQRLLLLHQSSLTYLMSLEIHRQCLVLCAWLGCPSRGGLGLDC
jgi:hypothetical protein